MESTKKQEGCCVVVCETPLDKKYWDAQYQANSTGWDLGKVSPPIKAYIDTIQQKDQRILIPGAGNAYEADYLLKNGFTNITIIDIAPSLTQKLEEKYQNNTEIHIITGDFFEHQGSYDLIIEQTFFCALPPKLRPHYTAKMHQLLSDNGILAGLLFNRDFEVSPLLEEILLSMKICSREHFILMFLKNVPILLNQEKIPNYLLNLRKIKRY
jgi:methyl halide transferase